MASRILQAAGVAYNLALGWIPDRVEVWLYNATPDSIVRYHWFGPDATAHATIVAGGGVYGWSVNGAVVAELDADTGFTAYEGSKVPVVLVDSPKPGAGDVKVAVTGDWTQAIAAAATARSATAVGTIIRPTTHNGYVYECTTAITTGETTEPTWPTTPGERVVDDDGYWTCREENIVNAGELGVTLGATLATDDNLLMVVAYKADKAEDLGDVA